MAALPRRQSHDLRSDTGFAEYLQFVTTKIRIAQTQSEARLHNTSTAKAQLRRERRSKVAVVRVPNGQCPVQFRRQKVVRVGL